MNKTELIAAVAAKTELKKKDAESAVAAVFDAISAELAKGGKVQLIGFGSFDVKKRKARVGRNPKTKESIKIAASKYPVFKAGKALKDKVAKKKK
jgi:DNA-binding protein HU-beta